MDDKLDLIKDKIYQLCQEKKFHEARAFFDACVESEEISSTSPEQMLWLSAIEGLAGNKQEEIKILSAARSIDPNNRSVLFALVRATLIFGEYLFSVEVAKDLLKLEEKSDDKYFEDSTYFYLSLALMFLNDRKNFRQVIMKTKDNHTERILGRHWSKQDMLEYLEHRNSKPNR